MCKKKMTLAHINFKIDFYSWMENSLKASKAEQR